MLHMRAVMYSNVNGVVDNGTQQPQQPCYDDGDWDGMAALDLFRVGDGRLLRGNVFNYNIKLLSLIRVACLLPLYAVVFSLHLYRRLTQPCE